METKHTPGPWSRNISAKYPVFAGPKGNHMHVASILSKPEYAEGDLNLVIAAPDLLAALEALFQHCSMIHNTWGDGCNQKEADAAIAAGRAAIAKATGGA